MATIGENLEAWSTYDWPQRGDEWSWAWGGTPYLWYGAIFPRLWGLLPAAHILEIGPGFGRCTQFLVGLAERLTVVDLLGRCIEACRERFASLSGIAYHVNDGTSLAMIEDGSVDLVFSFDSLVHAEHDVMRAYVAELARVLGPRGGAFLHHSNLGAYRDAGGRLAVENPHWRAESMTAALLREDCRHVGLAVRSQELIPWGSEVFNDCFSLIVRQAGPAETVCFENRNFPREAVALRHIAEVYGPAGPRNAVA